MEKDSSKVVSLLAFLERTIALPLLGVLNAEHINYGQFLLFGYLKESGNELGMKDIAKVMSFSTAAATGLVDKFEKRKIMKRSHAKDDRRKIRVRLTRKGLCILARVQESTDKTVQALMGGKGLDPDFSQHLALLMA
jgi:DNA-binding MarR family transcriptional regulator